MLKLKPSRKERVRKDSWQFLKFEKIALPIFVFFLPSQLAYHFWPQFAYIFGLRVDYLAPAVYLTDLLFLTLLPFLVARLFRLKNTKLKKGFLFALVIFTLALINIVLAKVPILSFIKWLVILKLILVGVYFYLIDLRVLAKTIYMSLFISVVFFSFIAVIQFIVQQTIGGPLGWLGERSFTADTPSIALVDLFGKSLMRVYSTFPHPNSLAGYLVVGLLIARGLGRRLTLWFLVPFLAFTLSFSQGAWISIILAFILSFFDRKILKYLPLLLVTFSFMTFLLPDKYLNFSINISERKLLVEDSLRLFSAKPVFGVGLNNSLIFSKVLQPVHNVYLLIASEAGVVGLFLFFWLLNLWFKKITNRYFLLALIFVLLTAGLDHYWFTLQQNQLLLSLLVGLSLNEQPSKNIL